TTLCTVTHFWFANVGMEGIIRRSVTLFTLWCVVAIVRQSISSKKTVARQHRITLGLTQLEEVLRGEVQLEKLGRKAIAFLAERLATPVGALYTFELDAGGLKLTAGHAHDPSTLPSNIEVGEGLVGQAARDGKMQVLDKVPAGHLDLTSSLGKSA